ncbi:hypothetical protein AGMMS50256_11090 [Betaproteobacteria bacterium]|nr:hypothetical protein AGMMS50256_11090 [Betaproteobacteria bacterium]
MFENTVRDGMGFFDPYSAMIACTEPRKGWGKINNYAKHQYGWIALCKYNAKNRMGAYAGERSKIFIINNGTLFNNIHESIWGVLE